MEQTDETFFPIPKAISADNSAFISNFPRSIDRLTLAAHSPPPTFSLDRSRIISEYFDFSLSSQEKEEKREIYRFDFSNGALKSRRKIHARTAKRVSGPSGRPPHLKLNI